MGLLDSVSGFLGGESSSAPSSIASFQQPFLEDLFQRAQDTSNQFGGQQFAQQFQNPSLQAFNQLAGGGFQTPGLQEGLQNFGNQQNTALQGEIDAGLNDISNNFNRNILPNINSGSALTNTSGGSRQGIAQGLAASDANRQAGDFVNRLRSQNFQGQQQNQLNAFNQLGGLQGQQNQAALSGLSQAPQLSNLGFTSQFGNLQNLSSLIGSPTVLGGGSQSTGGVGGSLGGAADIGALAMLSDRRLKKNIKQIGLTPKGQNIYSFNYLWDDIDHIGVMAQESPVDAVIELSSGYLAVDYSRIR